MNKIKLLFVVLLLPLMSVAGGKEEIVEIKTGYGNIYIWLYKDTPKHRENFLKLAREGYYDSTTFHRIIKDFMIQGGDPHSKDPAKKDSIGNGNPGYTVEAEIKPQYFHKKGVLSAARMPDNINPEKRSSGSQFYIVQGKKFTEAELQNAEKRIGSSMRKEFKLSDEAKKAYQEVGGSPWLDQQYTVFGEVLSGLDVVDKIATVKTDPRDRPLVPVRMDVNVLKMSKKQAKRKLGLKIPA